MTEDLRMFQEPLVFDHLLKLRQIDKKIIRAVGFAGPLRASRVRDRRPDVFRAIGERAGQAAFPSA